MNCLLSFFTIFHLFLLIETLPNHENGILSSLRLPNAFENPGNVGEQCFNETALFLSSLRDVAKVSVECLTYRNCSLKELMSMQDHTFAIQQFDAFGKIPADVLDINTFFEGSHEECQRVSGKKYVTNYCYLLIHLGKNATCPEHPADTPHKMVAPRFAVCMPASCDERDLLELFNQMTPLPLTACHVFCSNKNVKKEWGFWLFSVFMITMISVSVTATVVDYFRQKEIGMSAVNEQAYLLRSLLSFSIWSNSELILSVKEHKPGYIRSLDCIRTLSILWIISAHTYDFQFPYNNVANSLDFLRIPTVSRHLILNAFFSVDTFFVLSGVVVAYLFFWNKPKRGGVLKPATWILFYVHRYIRLTPPVMAFIGFFSVYSKFIQGPFAASEMDVLAKEAEICVSSWWRNLLYINNFVEKESQCYNITWFLAVDTQLYLLAPALLIALFFSSTGGSALIIGGCLGSVIVTYILFGAFDLTADFIGNGNQKDFRFLAYEMPWVQLSPFLLGIFVGFFMATYTKTRLKFHWIVPLLGWILSFVIAFLCLFGNYAYDSGEEWSVFKRATYFVFSRIGWSLFVSWVIVACHYGWGGPIDAFMSHPMWQPFGRLSYCVYIVHRVVLFWFFNMGGRSPHTFSASQMFLFHAIPATVLSYFFAFFWSALFEVPIVKIEKMFLEPFLVHRREVFPIVETVRVRRGAVAS